MSSLGKWLLASCALHLLAVTGAGMLSSLAQKPAAVIDLSQLGHSCREPVSGKAGGGAPQDPAPAAPVQQQPAHDQLKPQKSKRVALARPPAKKVQAAAKPAALAAAPGDNAATAADASGGLAAAGQNQAGAGGNSTCGGGSGGGGGGSGSGSGVYRGMYFGFITELVQKAAVYPLQARRMGWEGTVIVSFVIRENGGVTDAAVFKSSGHAVLDGSALAAVKKLNTLPSPPRPVEIRLPVAFRLTGKRGS